MIDGFNEQYPNVNVKYTSGGDNLAPLLSTAVEGGNPPDIAAIGQPGLMARLREEGRDQADRRSARARSSTTSARTWRTRRRRRHAVRRHVQGRQQIDRLVQRRVVRRGRRRAARDLGRAPRGRAHAEGAGITPYSVGVDVRLADHRPLREHLPPAGRPREVRPAGDARDPVDRPVGEGRARRSMADIVGDVGQHGRRHRRRARRPRCRTRSTKVFTDQPEAAMVVDRRLRPGRAPRRRSSRRRATTSSPSRRSRAPSPSVVGGGDIFVEVQGHARRPTRSSSTSTTPEAAEIWAKRGGFSSPNKNLDGERLPGRDHADDAAPRWRARRRSASTCPTSQPAAFGGTPGQGLLKEFTDFVANPNDIDGITQQMEAAATKAFG